MTDKDNTSKLTEVINESEKIEINGHINNYSILGVIGEGGMGTVYLAQQEKPIKRKVALKIVKPELRNNEVVARFESERQALALMSHPNIAQLFEAGETKSGAPYFAMEYVPGIPITTYCDQHKLSNEKRLKIFIDVCEAIQHAHYKGILHRDIKPSNILVVKDGEKHIPKIIDFGIAKALSGQTLSERTLYTQLGVIIGTPIYMSPEQAELSNVDADTRSDIYSLGVLLYELLIGVPPFEKSDMQKAGLLEILRKIREEDPPSMCTRFRALGSFSTEISKKRSSSEKIILKQIRGDIENIVLKALEKDRSRRYDSAKDFSADIRRFLNNEPIYAKGNNFFYKIKKLIRRNRIRIAIYTAVSIFLITLLTMLSMYTKRTKQYLSEKDKITIMSIPSYIKGDFFKGSIMEGDFSVGPIDTRDIEMRLANMMIPGPEAVYKSIPLWLTIKKLATRNNFIKYGFKINFGTEGRRMERLILADVRNHRHCWFDIDVNVLDDRKIKKDILFYKSPLRSDFSAYKRIDYSLSGLSKILKRNSIRGNYANTLPDRIDQFSLIVLLSVEKDLAGTISDKLFAYFNNGGNILILGDVNYDFFKPLFDRAGLTIDSKQNVLPVVCSNEDIVEHEITKGCGPFMFKRNIYYVAPPGSPLQILVKHRNSSDKGFVAVHEKVGRIIFVADRLSELIEKEEMFINIINLPRANRGALGLSGDNRHSHK